MVAAPTLLGCHGRRVLVVDGTSGTTPDTHENQQQWPQPKSQKPGCGWPLINLGLTDNVSVPLSPTSAGVPSSRAAVTCSLRCRFDPR